MYGSLDLRSNFCINGSFQDFSCQRQKSPSHRSSTNLDQLNQKKLKSQLYMMNSLNQSANDNQNISGIQATIPTLKCIIISSIAHKSLQVQNLKIQEVLLSWVNRSLDISRLWFIFIKAHQINGRPSVIAGICAMAMELSSSREGRSQAA